MADFDILKSMADLNNFIQRQQASMLQLYQFDYEQKKKEAKDKLINKMLTENKDPKVAAQEVDEEYPDYNFGNDLLVTGLTVRKMMPANTFAEINRIDKDKPVYEADNGYTTEKDAYNNYKPLEYRHHLTFYKEKNNAIKNVQVIFESEKGSFINDVQANISYNDGNPIIRMSVKDGDNVKVHEFQNIHKNSLKDGIAKELQINNNFMVSKIVEGISAGLKELNSGDKPVSYYSGDGNKEVTLKKENVSLPPTEAKISAIDIASNYNNLITPIYYMDSSQLIGVLKANKFVLNSRGGIDIEQKDVSPTVNQAIDKIVNAALLTVTHIFEAKDPIIANINKGGGVEPHYVFNIGTTDDDYKIVGGATAKEISGNKVYRRVLSSSIGNGMPIVIYYTGGWDKIENIVGARLYLHANEKQHIDQLSNYTMNGGVVDANFLNRFKKALTDLTLTGLTAFATNKYYLSSEYKDGVGEMTLKDGTIELKADEAVTILRNHIALVANFNKELTTDLLSIWQRSTKLNNIGNMRR